MQLASDRARLLALCNCAGVCGVWIDKLNVCGVLYLFHRNVERSFVDACSLAALPSVDDTNSLTGFSSDLLKSFQRSQYRHCLKNKLPVRCICQRQLVPHVFFHFQEAGTINRGTATSCRDGTGHSLSRWCGWFLPGWVSAISYFAVSFSSKSRWSFEN